MKWYDLLVISAVNTVLSMLPLIVKDEETKAHLKLNFCNLYYAIQRTYPELVTPEVPK